MTMPLVLIPCDVKRVGEYPFHAVGEKYINAVAHGSQAMPILMPAWGAGEELDTLAGHYDLEAVLDRVQGVFLPGSVSNVHPRRYAGEQVPMLHDEQRDEAVFPLIQAVLERDLPLFAVCRGFQELNVALGGTLHPRLHEVSGYIEHREDESIPRNARYEVAHSVDVVDGGLLHQAVGSHRIRVNSLHAQGVRDLAPALNVEGRAEDGLVEAVSLPGAWVFGVQWHPEWSVRDDPVSAALFAAFGQALRLSTER